MTGKQLHSPKFAVADNRRVTRALLSDCALAKLYQILFLTAISLALNVLIAAQTEITTNRPNAKNESAPQIRTWDFENGLEDWVKTGNAFDSQPIDGSSIATDRVGVVKIGGDYWRNLHYPVGQHGQFLILTDDASVGTLKSNEFTLDGENSFLSFLIAGSADLDHERLELQILPNSRADAEDLKRKILLWIASQNLARFPRMHDEDYLVALAVTAEMGGSGESLDLLQQKGFQLPQFLFGRAARFKIIDDSSSAHIGLDFLQLTATPPTRISQPVWGYADYHTHLMSNMAFGALKGVHTLWGDPGGAYDFYRRYPDAVNDDIPHCIPNHGGGITAEVFINEREGRANVNSIGNIVFDLLRGRLTSHGRSGGPEFRNFPSFMSGVHQQMHITQVRRNYEGGLRLVVAIAVHNQPTEYLASKVKNGRIDPSTEQDVIEAEVARLRNLADENRDWMQIAYSPAQAREIIRRNKLAVILGVEVDNLGRLLPGNNIEEEVKYLGKLGIRAVTPVHAVDNRLGGAAVFVDPYNWANDFLHRGDFNKPPPTPTFFNVKDDQCDQSDPNWPGKCVQFRLNDTTQDRLVIKHLIFWSLPMPIAVKAPSSYAEMKHAHKNTQGLTDDGAQYIRELMRLGMIIDTAHMSDETVGGVFDVLGATVAAAHPDCRGFSLNHLDVPEPCYQQIYPTIVSHAHFRRLLRHTGKNFLASEYDISDQNLEAERRIHGVLGPFVTEDPIETLPEYPTSVRNDCGMSSKSFAYSFAYGFSRMNGRGLGMATDFTFIPGVAPRFGPHACWGWQLATDRNDEKRHTELYNLEQKDAIVYEGVTQVKGISYGHNVPLKPYRINSTRKPYDFNFDGFAHYGLIPDMLQDLKNVGLPSNQFEALFSSAEDYLQMWEKAWTIAGCDSAGSECNKMIYQSTLQSHFR